MLYFYAILLQNVLVSQNLGSKVWGAKNEAQSVGRKKWGAKCEAQSMVAQWVNPYLANLIA